MPEATMPPRLAASSGAFAVLYLGAAAALFAGAWPAAAGAVALSQAVAAWGLRARPRPAVAEPRPRARRKPCRWTGQTRRRALPPQRVRTPR